MKLTYDCAELQKIYDERVAETAGLAVPAEIVELQDGYLAARAQLDRHVRLGGFVPGPTQLALADGMAWLLVIAHLPPDSDTLTTDLAAQFMAAAPLGEVTIRLRLRRLGARRAVVSAELRSPLVPRGPISEITAGFLPLPGSAGRPSNKHHA